MFKIWKFKYAPNHFIIMLWLVLALISAVTGGFISIIGKYILKKHDYICYAFMWNILSALFLLPIALLNFSLPVTLYEWGLLAIGVCLWLVVNITGIKSLKMVDVSLREPISQIRLLFVLILSAILISESVNFSKIIGTLLTFSGLLLITYKGGKFFSLLKNRGIQLTLLSAFFVSLVSIVDKTALKYWTVAPYLFFEFLIPGLIFGGMTFFRKDKFKEMMKAKYFYIFLVTVLGAASSYALYWAYQLEEVSVVYPITQLATLIAVIGGIVILKERKDILLKLLATVIMIAGAILISGYV